MVPRFRFPAKLLGRTRRRSPVFLPDGTARTPRDAWWSFTPEAIANLAAIAGFSEERIVYHQAPYREKPTALFTVVAKRV